jgi:hypothetical protein
MVLYINIKTEFCWDCTLFTTIRRQLGCLHFDGKTHDFVNEGAGQHNFPQTFHRISEGLNFYIQGT